MTAFQAAFQALKSRGCVSDSTANIAQKLGALLEVGQRVGVYAGFDPTAPSLHLGHASVVVMLQRLQVLGFKPYALIGGATALVGDPTGKREDRPLLSADAAAQNAEGIRRCLSRAIDFSENTAFGAVLVNNADFYRDMRVLDWLRDTGRHFRVSNMLAKDSVKARLTAPTEGPDGAAGPAAGLSFTEFAYQIFQASDFARLHAAHGVRLQVGGSDQWGNITAGIDLVRKTTGEDVHAMTLPLLTAADGRKFGKTEGNAVWLEPSMTSHHAFWQYLVRSEDEMVGKLLRQLTTLPEEQVQEVIQQHAAQPELKRAQLLLADTVTQSFRGSEAVGTARRCAGILYAGTAMWSDTGRKEGGEGQAAAAVDAAHLPQRALLSSIRVEDLVELSTSGDLPCITVPVEALQGKGVVEVMVAAGLVKSKGDARRLLESGGVYWNWERVSAREGAWSASRGPEPTTAAAAAAAGMAGKQASAVPRAVRVPEDLIGGKVAVLSAGKKRMVLVRLKDQ